MAFTRSTALTLTLTLEQVKADKAKTDEFRKSLAKLVRPNPNPNPKA